MLRRVVTLDLVFNFMARGPKTHTSSLAVAPLPKIEYELAKDDVFKLPAGVFDGQARGYGCGCHFCSFWDFYMKLLS
jgi:hypothetical protein